MTTPERRPRRRKRNPAPPEPGFFEMLAESIAQGIAHVATNTAQQLAEDFMERRRAQMTPADSKPAPEHPPDSPVEEDPNIIEGEFRYVEKPDEEKSTG